LAQVLYITYDGLTDPLGQSQVIPYVEGLAARGHRFHLLSCEKPPRFKAIGQNIAARLAGRGIRWTPLPYSKRPPVVATVYDTLRLSRAARAIAAAERCDIVHCRGYIPALVGRRLRQRAGTRFIFDMRGFWPEERVESGLWPVSNPVFRLVYHFFKREERQFLRLADGIVVLTEAARRELTSRGVPAHPAQTIGVVPCSVEFSLFAPTGARSRVRARLGIGESEVVVIYAGSLGTWYLLGEMLDFFRILQQRAPGGAVLLVVTPDSPALVERGAAARDIDPGAIRVAPALRSEVPLYMDAADIGLSFIRPTGSKMGSSPTKIGEYLAMGLPVVTNHGIGDTDEILERIGGGVFVDDFTIAAYELAAGKALSAVGSGRTALRESATAVFDIAGAVDEYDRVYRHVVRA
jgi:glycosyltransferase involved in cell wall biosynthesis